MEKVGGGGRWIFFLRIWLLGRGLCSLSSRRSRSKIYLRVAQTTVGDLGFAVRSVGISLGPGLVDAGSCDFRCAKAPRLRLSADLTPSAQAHLVDGPSLSADPPDLAAKQLMIGYVKNNEANGK